MNLIILLCVTHVVWADKVDFYHELSMTEFIAATNLSQDSFFGYSTTYDRFNKRMIISAPRENEIGEVYDCDITTKSCSKLVRKIHTTPPYNIDNWFGATVRSGSSFIVACAPRTTGLLTGLGQMYGRCFRRNTVSNKFTSEVKPSKNMDTGESVEHQMQTLGWSLDIGPDDHFIVGGPGMYEKRGLAAFSQSKTNNILLPIKLNARTKVSFNFGYSVAVGYFLELGQLSYAVGSTYGAEGLGQVYFISYDEDNRYIFDTQLRREASDDVVGSMFGAVLCAASLVKRRLGTKASDLLVGAPTYIQSSGYDAGAVFVYIFSDRGRAPMFKRKLKSFQDGSHFGSAIVNCGDLNGDGVDEVAIGAPYEDDGHGAVYLYCGASLSSDKADLSLRYMQRLQPKGPHRSFGFSIAPLMDYDENGCNELAVSAPYENKVMLYRCMAAVTITELTAEFPDLQNRTLASKTDFQFKVCLHIKYPIIPKEIHAEISTDVQINHESAKLMKPNKESVYNFKSSLHDKQTAYCELVDITLPLEGDYSMEIGYEISTTLLDSPILKKEFNERNVILSDISNLHRTGSVWAAECSGKKECISNLTLTLESSIREHFVIGSREKGTLAVKVLNTGEVAYDPCVHVNVVGAKVYHAPMDCGKSPEVENTWECITRKSLRTDKYWEIDYFVIDLTDLTSADTLINYNVTLFSNCKNKNISQSYEHKIALESSTQYVEIKGTHNYGEVVAMKRDDLLINGKHLEHIYTISNNDVTNLVDLISTVKLQKEKYIHYSAAPVSYYTDGNSKTKQEHKLCSIISETATDLTASCKISRLSAQDNVKVVASIEMVPSADLHDTVVAHNVTVNSTITLQLPHGRVIDGRLSTLLTLQTAYVDLWIMILAGIVGIFMILILALILYECGFLRRKNKEELKKLKTSVKRQTIRRSAMMQPSQTEDRLNILGRMEEVDESPEMVQQPHP